MFKLSEKQQEIVDSNADIKLVIGAMRSGKSFTAILNMWEQMYRLRSPFFKGLYLVRSMPIVKMTVRNIKSLLPTEHFYEIVYKNDYAIVRTSYGEIFVSTRYIDFDFENKTIDEATSNKYVGSKEFWNDITNSKFYLTGHFPANMDNIFFKLWLKEYFSTNEKVKSFILNETFCNFSNNEEKEKVIKSTGENRFNREYLAIPDYFELELLTDSNK